MARGGGGGGGEPSLLAGLRLRSFRGYCLKQVPPGGPGPGCTASHGNKHLLRRRPGRVVKRPNVTAPTLEPLHRPRSWTTRCANVQSRAVRTLGKVHAAAHLYKRDARATEHETTLTLDAPAPGVHVAPTPSLSLSRRQPQAVGSIQWPPACRWPKSHSPCLHSRVGQLSSVCKAQDGARRARARSFARGSTSLVHLLDTPPL